MIGIRTLNHLFSIAMNDFCYVANLQNFTWTPQFANLKLPNANGITGARIGHSGIVRCHIYPYFHPLTIPLAVLDSITNRLYILFGF